MGTQISRARPEEVNFKIDLTKGSLPFLRTSNALLTQIILPYLPFLLFVHENQLILNYRFYLSCFFANYQVHDCSSDNLPSNCIQGCSFQIHWTNWSWRNGFLTTPVKLIRNELWPIFESFFCLIKSFPSITLSHGYLSFRRVILFLFYSYY